MLKKYLTLSMLWLTMVGQMHAGAKGKSGMPASAITYLFSHGIAANKDQAFSYTKTNAANANHIIDNENHKLITFDYPDAGHSIIYPTIQTWSDLLEFKRNIKKISYRVDRANTSFAQENEIKVLHETHASIDGNTHIIGVGVSRGASALIMDPQPNIKALILESPFDSMDSIVRNIIGEYLYQYPAARSLAHNLVRFIFSRYNKRATTPLEAAANIPKDLPILIICSEEDSRVPAWSSEKLAKKLQETNKNTHFIKLAHGSHGKLIQGPDGETYRNIVHAFYQKYDLPHHPEYAVLGKELLEKN